MYDSERFIDPYITRQTYGLETGRPSKSDKPVRHLLKRLIFLAVVLVLWQALTWTNTINTVLLPPPTQLTATLREMMANGELADHVLASLQRIVIGFLLASAGGILLGATLGTWEHAAIYLTLLIELIRPIPPIAWIPFAILWFGLGDLPAYFIVALAAFFPIFVNTMRGFASVKESYVLAARNLGAGRMLLLTDVVLPASLPFVLAGLRIGIGIAWMSVIAAELVGSRSGLGYMIQLNRIMLRTDKIAVGMILIGVLGFLMSQGIALIEDRLLAWHREI